MFSNTGFSLISKRDWVYNCKNSYGEAKKTYDFIRSEMGFGDSKATCGQSYDRVVYIRHLNFAGKKVSDLSPLNGLTNLERLDLQRNNISSLNPLSGLINLQSLDLEGNKISDLSPLARLTKLEHLVVGEDSIRYGGHRNRISDLSPLVGLKNLKFLKLGHNQISDLSYLKFLTKLVYLDLNFNQISDISPLAGLTKLKDLNLSNNQISNIYSLSYLTELCRLNLSYNQISNLSPLKLLKNLIYLDLNSNYISELSDLAELRNLEWLYISKNQISNISPIVSLTKLSHVFVSNNQIADFSSVDSGLAIIGKDEQDIAKFYSKLMEDTQNTIALLSKLNDLPDLIEDVHQMKFYYSLVMYSYRTGAIDSDERDGYIQNGLLSCSKFTTDEDQWTIYRLILDKALQDGIINREQEIRFNIRGQLVNIENAAFIKDIQRAVKANTSSIKGLEGDIRALQKNIETVNDSLNKVKLGLKRKMDIESSVGFMGAVLNAVSFGAAGSALQAVAATTMADIIDFSDFTHMQEIAESVGYGDVFVEVRDTVSETDLAGAIGVGLSTVEDSSEDNLEKAVSEKSPMVVIAAMAAKIDDSQTKQTSQSTPTVPSQVFANSQKSTISSLSGYDSGFESDDEDDFPLHAAIKYSDLELLNEELDNCAQVNKLDKHGRTPADFAAIKGEEKMMKLIVEMGGYFKKGSKAKMRKVCRDRAAQKK